MQTRIETITPKDAEFILARNKGNRNIRNTVVMQYAEMMTKGQWDLTPHGIVIDRTGNLLDGQHRLCGVIMAGVAVNFTVTRDCDPEIFRSLDRGARRTDQDLIGGKRMVVEVCSVLARFIHPNDKNIRNVENIYNSNVGELFKELDVHCGTSRAPYSNAFMRIGAVVNVLKNPATKSYVFDLYRTLVLNKFEDMPPIGFATVRRVGNIAKKFKIGPETLSISMYVFNERNKNSSQIKITSDVLDNVSADIRNNIFSVVDDIDDIDDFTNVENTKYISYEARTKMWNVKVMHLGKRINFGHFKSITQAVEARDGYVSRLKKYDRQPTTLERRKIREETRKEMD